MDEETRGRIEEALDKMILETDTTDVIRWVLRETNVHSPEDFALGYLIGSLTRYAYIVARKQKFFKKRAKLIEGELEKIRSGKMKERSEDVKPVKVDLTKREDTQIRNMLRRRLVDMKRKVYRDFHR